MTRTVTGEVVTQRAASADELQMTIAEAEEAAVDEAIDSAITGAKAS